MRQINTVIQEATDFYPKESLLYCEDRDFLGIDAHDQQIDFIPPDQVQVARYFLADKPSGSKMHCYTYGPLIQYRFDNIGYDNSTFVLTHTFMRIHNELCAISNRDNETFLFEKKYFARDPGNEYEIERRGIKKDEWRSADQLIDLYLGNRQMLSGNKLRHRQKHYRFFEIADYDESGLCSKRIVKMTHSFYHINNKLYALSGNGHQISGSFGKVKVAREYAMREGDIDYSASTLVVLKIPKKIQTFSQESCSGIRSEYALYQKVGLSDAAAVKQKSEVSNSRQEICVMRFFHTDLSDSISQGHLIKMVSRIDSAASLESRERLLINLIRVVADIFLKLLNQLDININQHRFLHRDIKPENIVLTTKIEKDELSRVMSVQCIEAMFIDFGAAKKIEKPGEWTVTTEYPVGTIGYCAPEVNHVNASGPRQLCYTDKTDIYALGKTLSKVMNYLFKSILQYLNNTAHAKSRDLHLQLTHISNMMCFEAPAERLSVEYVRILLLNTLWQSSSVDPMMNEVQKRESFSGFIASVNGPFRHIETLMCLMTITRLTGVMIIRRTNIQNAVELKSNLSKDLLQLFCRLDSLITHSRCGELVLKLFDNVNHILSRWDAAISPSPIDLFEREISQPDYQILRDQSYSSGSLSVGGLFSSSQPPSRRQRSVNNAHKNDDDFDP